MVRALVRLSSGITARSRFGHSRPACLPLPAPKPPTEPTRWGLASGLCLSLSLMLVQMSSRSARGASPGDLWNPEQSLPAACSRSVTRRFIIPPQISLGNINHLLRQRAGSSAAVWAGGSPCYWGAEVDVPPLPSLWVLGQEPSGTCRGL